MSEKYSVKGTEQAHTFGFVHFGHLVRTTRSHFVDTEVKRSSSKIGNDETSFALERLHQSDTEEESLSRTGTYIVNESPLIYKLL